MTSATDFPVSGQYHGAKRKKQRVAATERTISGAPLVMFMFGCVALDWRFSDSEVNIGNIIFLFSCVGAWLATFIAERGQLRPRAWQLIDTIFLAYVLLIACSSYWSVLPSGTLTQSVFIGGMWATTVMLGNQPIERLISYIVHTAFWIAVLSLLMVLLTSDALQPRTGELRGVYFHQLRLGLFMSIALGLMCLTVLNGKSSMITRNKFLLALYFVVIGIACAWAFARLYTFFAIVALIVTVMLPRNRRLRVLFLAGMALLVGWLVLDQNSILGALNDQGVDLSLSGRTRIWEKSLTLVQDRTAWGFGFATFDAPVFNWAWRGYRPAHPHNSYIQAFFENGWPGLILTLALVATHVGVGLRSTGASRPNSYSLFLVMTAVLGALTGSVYSGKLTAFFALVMLVVSIDSNGLSGVIAPAKRQTRSKEAPTGRQEPIGISEKSVVR